ncbi:DUF1214 domain-containing protein [Sphingomonas sp. TF3]|uniref:DUF1214 domain-containing protein n=1 Tax=Sphingomonas sp. TF3 TaxID=2495580 RepID=UPI000F874296|nr:DUF1214 domain-containing protein [Sphingomonas sp. TF3]RUN76873.1 DUF1214 domain-containing protein [Sphingomonas sp. TF3]
MRGWARYLVGTVAGVALGLGGAVYALRSAALGNNVVIGPWATGQTFGSVAADPYTRAVVALKGLLALPAQEARYYTAARDSAGAPLEGRCRYRITGAALPAAWWSLTAYDPDGYLVPNAAGRYSVAGAAFPDGGKAGWTILLAPTAPPPTETAKWLPSGGIARVELTLRTYLPSDGGRGNPGADILPKITREAC